MANQNDILDVIIVGAGPAGLSAGVYVARKKLKGMIITKDVGGQTAWSSEVENYLGYHLISGLELAGKFREHLSDYDFELKEGSSVKKINKNKDGIFEIETDKGDKYKSKTIIIASGKIPRELGVPGEQEFRGKGVTYCATCDAPLFSGKDVVVVGGGNSALDAIIQLDKIANKIYSVNINPDFKGDEIMIGKVKASDKVELINNTGTVEITGDKFVGGIKLKHKESGEERELSVQGIFIEIGSIPSVDFFEGLIELNEKNEIIIDKTNQTNVEGIFAAGDVTEVIEKQTIVAAGEGAKAAIMLSEYLAKKK